MEYRARVVDAELRRALASAGAIVIEGPKACGKTLTARQVAASELRVDTDPRVPPAIAVDPSLLLDGAPPQLLDEWQVQPALWNHVRRAVDDHWTYSRAATVSSGAIEIQRVLLARSMLADRGSR